MSEATKIKLSESLTLERNLIDKLDHLESVARGFQGKYWRSDCRALIEAREAFLGAAHIIAVKWREQLREDKPEGEDEC